MEIQHINVKVFVEDPAGFTVTAAVAVFHRWIREASCPEMLIDVADYDHVAAGPGTLLIGHEANYSFDHREHRLGLLYNRKAAVDGTLQDRLAQAHGAALAACDKLEREPEFNGKLKFDHNSLELFINDRLLAPNTDVTWEALQPELAHYFSGFGIERRGEARDLFRVSLVRPRI